jgi:peptidoglycan-associated lipoprotein
MAPRVAAYLDPNNLLYRERSFYFDYDGSSLRGQDQRLVEAHGGYLAGMPTLQVRVEGHTDERGSREYNLALGQRRAEAVKSALMVLGVRDSQVEAVSFGKEKPRAMGHDEADWAQNRRVDIVYPFAPGSK